MRTDTECMLICQALAEAAATKGNPAVGSVIVWKGEIIARGEEATGTQGDITAHAEMEAIREAVGKIGKDLSDCVLYATHEPCVMCGYAIRYHRIGKVVIGSAVPYLGSVSSAFALLTSELVPPHWSSAPQVEWFTKEEE